MSRKICFIIMLVLPQLLACGGGQTVQQTPVEPVIVTGKAVFVDNFIPYAENVYVNQAVKNECNLNNKLSGFIQAEGKGSGTNVVGVDKADAKKGRILSVKIVNVHGAGGGAWSGAKSVTVEGKLTENGKVIGTFRGSRYSGGGVFGGFKGTCDILGRCVKALGSDIAGWLKSPVMNASLGDGSR